MYIQDWYVNVVEQFGMKLDGIAGGKEDHYLLVPVLLEESEEEKKPLLGGAYYISLLQSLYSGRCLVIVDTHIERRAFERERSQVFNTLGLGGREQNCLPLLWQ
jgi:dsDNA-specific endonuclease/ATPase MutS2